jgi:hypothetical protein
MTNTAAALAARISQVFPQDVSATNYTRFTIFQWTLATSYMEKMTVSKLS